MLNPKAKMRDLSGPSPANNANHMPPPSAPKRRADAGLARRRRRSRALTDIALSLLAAAACSPARNAAGRDEGRAADARTESDPALDAASPPVRDGRAAVGPEDGRPGSGGAAGRDADLAPSDARGGARADATLLRDAQEALGDGGGPAVGRLRVELPCRGPAFVTAEVCNWDPVRFQNPTRIVTTLGGDPNMLYDVKLRVRGNVEPRTYARNGQLVTEHKDRPGFAAAATPTTDRDDYQTYSLEVSEPRTSNGLNALDRVGHLNMAIDYTVVIKARGAAMLTLVSRDGNDRMIANFTRAVVPGLPPAPEPFNGQLLQIDVLELVQAR